jgi:peptidoglycan/LPS O-acetylase OafA/YrhL
MPPTHSAERKPHPEATNAVSEPPNSPGVPYRETPTTSSHQTLDSYSRALPASPLPQNDRNTAAAARPEDRSPVLKRDKRIDCLRGIAVLSVVFVHSVIRVPFLFKAGWMGVDLFFVLSGFLISGLLFREYQKRGAIDFKRFFIRRAFKIYPSFWLFIAVTWGIAQLRGETPAPTALAYVRELLFVQNYNFGVWVHTWSLAVEEHFYIFLPLFLLALTRWSRHRRDPFRSIGWCAALIGVACMFLRAALVLLPQTPNFNLAYRATHTRIDSLFFGVFLGYLYNFHGPAMAQALRSPFRRIALAAISAALLCPGYFAHRNDKSYSILVYTLVYLGFGGILLLAVHVRDVLPAAISNRLRPFGDALAFIGVYSYSIYLWHYAVREWPDLLAYGFFHAALGPLLYLLVYLVLTLMIGIAISRAVEYPILKLRDRLFPEQLGR